MNPSLPSDRAFVVWLNDEADPSIRHLCGRVEHVRSGRRGRFASLEELNEFVALVLVGQEPDLEDGPPS